MSRRAGTDEVVGSVSWPSGRDQAAARAVYALPGSSAACSRSRRRSGGASGAPDILAETRCWVAISMVYVAPCLCKTELASIYSFFKTYPRSSSAASRWPPRPRLRRAHQVKLGPHFPYFVLLLGCPFINALLPAYCRQLAISTGVCHSYGGPKRACRCSVSRRSTPRHNVR